MFKYFIFTFILCLNLSLINAQSLYLTDTKGNISVGGSGDAQYTIPIPTPFGVNGVGPNISLFYTSNGENTIAGYGWNISGLSSISRVGNRLDLDGFLSPINLDNQDKLMLNGQRLILKTGVHLQNGAEYQTEFASNIKIIYTDNSFIVYYPNGVREFYGTTAESKSPSEWLLYKWLDIQNNYILYEYINDNSPGPITYQTITYIVYWSVNGPVYATRQEPIEGLPIDNNVRLIKTIRWGKNETFSTNFENTIVFNYTDRLRPEITYIHQTIILSTQLLNTIDVYCNGTLFRKFQLTHETTSGNYQRLVKVQEFNGLNEAANPLVFEYENGTNAITENEYQTLENHTLLKEDKKLTGDFDNDGNLDFIINDKLYLNYFVNNNTWNTPLQLEYFYNYETASLLNTNQKLNNNQTIVGLTPYATDDLDYGITIKTFNFNPARTVLDNTMSVNLPIKSYDKNWDDFSRTGTNFLYTPQHFESFAGDFNGDGITEILVKTRQLTDFYFENGSPTYRYIEPMLYMVNINGVSNDANYTHIPNITFYDKTFVQDFNADGKTDLLTINKTLGLFLLYTFNNNAPFLINSGYLKYNNEDFDIDGIVFGDFNGDRKIDFLIPKQKGSPLWNLYISQSNTFNISQLEIVNYEPDVKSLGSENFKINGIDVQAAAITKTKNIITTDVNNDGKTDIVVLESRLYSEFFKTTWSSGYITKVAGTVLFYENIFSKNSGTILNDYNFKFKLILEKSFVKDRNTTDKDLLLPFFLETTNNLHYNNANVLFVYKDKIWRFDYDNDLKKTMRLAKIIELNGIKKTSFTYTEIVPGQYYSSADAEVYPYKELQKLPKTYSLSSASVVSYLGILKQDYAYSGFTIHSQGLGYIGFKKKFTTNWYDVNNPKKIWSVIETSPQLMGQVIAQWSFGDTITNPLGHPYYSSPPLTNGSNSPSFTAANTSKDLSCVTYNYAVNFNQFGRGIKSILPITVTAYDFLTNSKTITYNQYDNYNNLIYIRTSNSLGYKSTTYSLTNNTTGIGNEYFVGRLVKTIDTMAFYNDLYSTQDQYFYNNGLLVNSIKSYNNNPQTIATSMAYDAVGNITSSTTTVGTKSRTSTTVYDANYRLTISKTDIEGKTTTYINNDLGQQLSVTNYLGQTQTNTYNRWGKVISITNNAHETTIETKIKFERFVSGDLNVETSDNIGNYKLESFDIAGNLMKTKSKGFLTNSFREQINEYDVLGMKTKASEPYFLEYSRNIKLKDEQTGGFVIDPETGKIVTEKQIIVPATPNEDILWTTYIYDYLNRPICTNLPNGKIITNTFNGLVSTGFDGVKTSEQWLDVNGNKTKIIDNGQTIFYFYNANGTIKNTNYNGHCVSFTYDDWGRKTSQLDSSVNYKPYRYAYNEWGEQIAEYTPNNDSTIITYNIYGKVLQKTSIGINTNSNIIYSYNDNLFLIEESGTIYSGTFPSKYTKSYLYDTKNRLIKTTETTPFIVTENNLTYDIYGRLNTKNINAYFVKFNNYTNGNKTIKYSYSSWNGMNTVIQDNNSLDTLWVMRNTNQNMQLTSGEYGNGTKLNYTYNNLGMPLELNEFSTNQNFINLSYTYDLPRGLTLSRKNHVVNIEENFLYDIEERLIEWSSSNRTEHQTYTADGRIHTSS
ncbi:MAG: SpvB/TcaC N-terminal domain-containing protein, partial [Alphaproteobacteria bacterium]|nr:SpvB/TcaC N-terminal domain-containing protein [Alphaproteobacteria bacterium]